jgi:hypothetical protein
MKKLAIVVLLAFSVSATAQWTEIKAEKGEQEHLYLTPTDTLAIKCKNLYTNETCIYSMILEKTSVCLDKQEYGKFFSYYMEGIKDRSLYDVIIVFSDNSNLNLNESLGIENITGAFVTAELTEKEVLLFKTKSVIGISVGGVVRAIPGAELIKKTANVVWFSKDKNNLKNKRHVTAKKQSYSLN